jgi:predicted RNA binding protein YcfA (HicA-like mRNA interferase family)
MKLPRDLSGADLAKALSKVGDEVARRKGSHIRLTTQRNGEHHVTIPDHDTLKIGTLTGILADVGEHLALERDALVRELFPKKKPK